MEIVLNDYSIDGQFRNVDELMDSLATSVLPILNILNKCNINILKAYDTWNRKLTPTVTMRDVISSNVFRGFSEAQKLRSLLCELQDEPYWEESLKTCREATYFCDVIGNFTGEYPNCFSEATERDKMILSLEHKKYKNDIIQISKDNVDIDINNIHNKKSVASALFVNKLMGFSEMLFNDRDKIEFYASKSNYYADELFDSGELSQEDAFIIKNDFDLFLDGREKGNILSRLTDSISYKNITYYEFRTTLPNKREYRLFYIYDGERVVFFNALIKKTQQTPERIKKRTYDLIMQYKANKK